MQNTQIDLKNPAFKTGLKITLGIGLTRMILSAGFIGVVLGLFKVLT